MDAPRRRKRGLAISALLICGGLAVPACGSPGRTFATGVGGSGGQTTSSNGGGGIPTTADSGSSSRGSNEAGDAGASEVGTGTNAGNGGSAAETGGAGGDAEASSGGSVSQGGSAGVPNLYCGDGAIRSGFETCDDGNAVTESCSYGQSSCTVCDATCHSIAGAISYCGDSVRQPAQEACDNGAANSTSSNCSPTCTACDKIAGSEPVTYNDSSWTGGLSFTATKATTLHQFKVYHNDSPYRLSLYQLTAPDTAPAADATPIWKTPATGQSAPKASTFDTIDVSISLSAGKSYLLTIVGQVMGVAVPNPAVAFPVENLSGLKVTKAFSVSDSLELDQGTFSNTHWGPFTDLRSCMKSPT